MGKRLERFGEVRIIDETNGFGLDFVEKTKSRDVGSDDSRNAAEVHRACPGTCLPGEGHPDGGDSWIEKSGLTKKDLLEWDKGGDGEVYFKSSLVGTRLRGVQKLHCDGHNEWPPS